MKHFFLLLLSVFIFGSPVPFVNAATLTTSSLEFNFGDRDTYDAMLGTYALQSSDVSIDTVAGKISGTFGHSDKINQTKLVLSGTFNPETYEIHATFTGTASESFGGIAGGYDWGAGSATTIFGGSVDGVLSPKSFPQWEGQVTNTYSSSKQDLTRFKGVHASALPVGTKESGTFRFYGKGNLLPIPVQGQQFAKIDRIEGDVEIKRAGTNKFVALKATDQINIGDVISAGFQSSVDLTVGDRGTLHLYEVSETKFDAWTVQQDLHKLQVNLTMGHIKLYVKEKHTDSIRSDFSVTTPIVNASIRGSEMIVGYDDKLNHATVFVTSDKAYVKGAKDAQETVVLEGNKVNVDGTDQKVGSSTKFNASELPAVSHNASGFKSIWVFVLVGILVAGGIGLLIRKRK